MNDKYPMRVIELLEIDAAAAANAAVAQAQQQMQQRQTEAQRSLERSARAFLASYRTEGNSPALTRAVQALIRADADSTRMYVVAALFDTLRTAIPAIQQEVRSGGEEVPAVNAQLGNVIREFVANNTLRGEFNDVAALLLRALAQ